MIRSTPSVTPLRQRMLDDMRMRKLEPKTQAGYLRAVRHLAVFLKASPDTATGRCARYRTLRLELERDKGDRPDCEQDRRSCEPHHQRGRQFGVLTATERVGRRLLADRSDE